MNQKFFADSVFTNLIKSKSNSAPIQFNQIVIKPGIVVANLNIDFLIELLDLCLSIVSISLSITILIFFIYLLFSLFDLMISTHFVLGLEPILKIAIGAFVLSFGASMYAVIPIGMFFVIEAALWVFSELFVNES